MDKLLDCITYFNAKFLREELLDKINNDNQVYNRSSTYIFDLIFVNPHYCMRENRLPKKRGVIICVKEEELEDAIRTVVASIPYGHVVYFFSFFGYAKPITARIFPDFKILKDKKILLQFNS